MTNQQILTKAIQKAIDGGWDKLDSELDIRENNVILDAPGHDIDSGQWVICNHEEWHYTDIIFNHDFAKALWGEFPTYTHSGFERYGVGKDVDSWLGPAKEAIKDKEFVTGAINYTAWKYHLQQMVIADDPIKYLGEHL